jgi:hypothetical protein
MSDAIRVVSDAPQNTTFGMEGNGQVVDATFGAGRVSIRPNEFIGQGVGGGHYRAAATSGALTGVGAGAAVFSMRWAPPNGGSALFLLKRVQVSWILTTAYTAAQTTDLDIVRCTAFTAADTGGTALTPFTGNNNKVRSGLMATSIVADMRISSTAALGAGTKTQDANPFSYLSMPPQGAANTAFTTGTMLTDLYAENILNEHPQMFGANEGFNVRAVTAMGATGVIKLYVVVEWAEVPGL